MATLNVWSGIGRLGDNPAEIKVTREGQAYTKFSLAVDLPKNETMWLPVTAWDKQAEAVEKYAIKGTLVYVQGQLLVRKYKDKQHQDRVSVEINATNVQILEKRKKGDDLPDDVLPA